jgi:hypothetical protein
MKTTTLTKPLQAAGIIYLHSSNPKLLLPFAIAKSTNRLGDISASSSEQPWIFSSQCTNFFVELVLLHVILFDLVESACLIICELLYHF